MTPLARRGPQRLLVGVLLLGAVLIGIQLNPYLGDYGDDAEFLILGQGLARGQGYAWVNSPDDPAHNRYPPGYPVALAGALAASGTRDAIFAAIVPAKIVTAALTLAAALPFWLVARRRLPALWALSATALFVCNPFVVRFAAQVMSDTPYLLLEFAALAWGDTLDGRRSPRRWAVFGLLLAGGAYFRSLGLATAAGALLWALVRSRRGGSIAVAAFVVAMAPWWVRDFTLAGGWRYLEEFGAAQYADPGAGTVGAGGIVARALDNGAFFLGKPAKYGIAGIAVAAAGTVVCCAGFWRLWLRRIGPAEWIVVPLVAAVLLWPIKTGRYLLPVIPLAGVYAIAGTLVLSRYVRPHPRHRTRVRVPGGSPASRHPLRGSPGGEEEPSLGEAGVRSGTAGARYPACCRPAPAGAFLRLAGAAVVVAFLVEVGVGVWTGGQNLRALAASATPDGFYRERPDWAHYLQAAQWLREHAGQDDVAMARRHFALYVYSGHFTEKYRYDTSDEEIAYLTAGTQRKFVVEDAFDVLRGDFGPLPGALRGRGGDLILRFETAAPAVRVWELVRP
jgi:hypothetical protein